MKARIHPTAVIDPGARLAADVEVGPYSVIGDRVEVGEGTWIGPRRVLAAIPRRPSCTSWPRA